MVQNVRIVLFVIAASLGLFWAAVGTMLAEVFLHPKPGPLFGWSIFFGVTLFLWWVMNRHYHPRT